jgi:hypothetical protein
MRWLNSSKVAAIALAVATVGAAASGCEEDVPGLQEGNIGPAERQIIGMADPYPADPTVNDRIDELNGSMTERRKLGWEVLGKALAPVPLKEQEIAALEAEGEITIPRFLTWYQKTEFKRMFHQLYKAHGADNRAAKAPFSDALLRGDKETGSKGIFEWNANYLAEKGLPEDIYLNRLAKIQEEQNIPGLTGVEAIAYSPAMVMHFFENYTRILDCLKPVEEGFSGTILDRVGMLDQPISEDNFTLCYDEEFPIDAVLSKGFWANQAAQPALPTYDTTAAGISARLASQDAGWMEADGQAEPTGDEILTAKLSNGSSYRMSGLHVITKEARHWVWVTMWWSDDPNSDFGADRPDFINDLGTEFQNYKMCVVTDFEEGDIDPRAGYPSQAEFDKALSDRGLTASDELPDDLVTMKKLVSLGDALGSTHRGAPGPTWCSNPYVEEGPHNAASNCIGCHQHGGTPIAPLQTLFDEQVYPAGGTALVRNNFPSDYLWVFDKKARLGRILQGDVQNQDRLDM